MNKAKKMHTINDITSIDFNLANRHQIENYDINFEHGAGKIMSKRLSFS